MDKQVFVADLADGQRVRTLFLVGDKRLGTTKNGKPFLTLELVDNSGSITARVWDDAEAVATRFEQEDIVLVEGQVDTWKDNLQLNLRDLKSIDADEVELGDFIPASRWGRDEMLEQLKDLVSREVKSPDMLRFLDALFDEKELMRQFVLAPAAKGNHHAYLGGLVEHTLSMSRLAVRLSRHYAHYYPGMINQDLIIAGCILHDIGKCFELSYGRSFDYTDEGRLVGHIVQGAELITTIASKVRPPLPAEMLTQLKHLVLSHHGKKEYGSPVRPQTPEAMLLHQIDMIDSRMAMCANIRDDHQSGPQPEEPWAGYQRLFQANFYIDDEAAKAWARVRQPAADEIEGPGAVPRAKEGAAPSDSSEPASEGESEPNLDLFPD